MSRCSIILLLTLVFGLGAQGSTAQGTERGDTMPTITPEEFAEIAWITGRWRGTGGGALASVPPFYEEYLLVNDSTVRFRSFGSDSTFTTVSDRGEYTLHNGQVTFLPETGNPRAITHISADSIHVDANGGVSLIRMTEDHWRAQFGSAGGVARFYDMRRWPNRPES